MFKGIIDTTLRDGQQSPLMFDTYKYRFSLEEKTQIVEGLIKLGVTHIEFFAPNVSVSERNDFRELQTFIRKTAIQPVTLIAHCRCHETDIQEAVEAGFDGLNLYMAVSDQAQQASYGKNLAEILTHIQKTIAHTRKTYPDIYIRFSIEDAFRTPLSRIYRVYDTLAPYVNTFGIPDTVGIATPEIVKKTVIALKKRYPNIDLECHFHNDRGYSLINAITAIQAGASYIDTTVWGMAERSGITSMTALLLNLYEENHEYMKNINVELCYPLNALMGSILQMQVPFNEPVSITNRTHTAGVHQKAVINNKQVYEGHNLEIFGVHSNQLLLGPLSGWNLIYYYLREVMYMDVTKEEAKKITQIFKNADSRMNGKIPPEKILKEIIHSFSFNKIPVEATYLEKRVENIYNQL